MTELSRVSVRWKLSYGIGQVGSAVSGFGFGTLLFIYYNQALGLPGVYAGAGLAISLVFDAISDPVVGSWSDGFKSRWGRRHPFMLFAIVPLGLLFFALFWPPEGLSEIQLFAWFTVFSVLSRTALSFFHVPYMSLGAELSQDYGERTRIAMYRYMVGPIASLLVVAVVWNFIFLETADNPSPQLTREPYLPYAVFSALVMGLLMLVSVLGTRDAIPHLAGAGQAARRFSVSRVYLDLFEALRSHSYRVMFLSALVAVVWYGSIGALALHLQTFFWQLDTTGIQWMQYAMVAGGICGVPFTGVLNRLFDKKWTIILCGLVTVGTATLPVLFALFELMPSSESVLVPTLVVVYFIHTFAGGPTNVTIASMMGDVADEHELRHGTRQEGIYFGSMSFAEKCTGAVGSMLAGFAVDLVGLDPNSTPGEVPGSVLFNLGAVYCSFAVLIFLSLWIFYPYGLNRRRHEEILAALQNSRRRSN